MWVRLATLDLQLPPLCWEFAPFAAITNSLTPICGGVAVLQYHIFYNVLRLKSKHKIISMTFRSRSLPHFGAYSEGYGYGGSLPRHHRPHSSLAEYRGGVTDPTSRRSHSSLGEYRQPQSSRYVLSAEYQVLSTEY